MFGHWTHFFSLVKNRNEKKPIKHVPWHFLVLFWVKDLPPVPELDFGLWARVSQRSLRPRSPFYDWSAVCPHPLSPRSLLPTGQRFSIPNHVTSGSGDVTSGHVTSGWAPHPSGQWFPLLGATQQPIRGHMLSTNQKPGNLLSGRTVLLTRKPANGNYKVISQLF